MLGAHSGLVPVVFVILCPTSWGALCRGTLKVLPSESTEGWLIQIYAGSVYDELVFRRSIRQCHVASFVYVLPGRRRTGTVFRLEGVAANVIDGVVEVSWYKVVY